MAKRTPPKKQMEEDKNRKEKQPLQKGKGKVTFAEPVENDVSDASEGSDDISEETEGSVNEEGDKEPEDSDNEGELSGDEGPGSEDDGLQDALDKVVKIAAAMSGKKKSKGQASTVEGASTEMVSVKEEPEVDFTLTS